MADFALNQWAKTEDYLVRVEDIKDETVLDGGLSKTKKTRSVRLLVAYQNKKLLPLKHVTLQWLLYDTDGYNYGSELSRHFYGDDAPRKLQEGYVGPGKTVKGWVAFKVPKDAVLSQVMFRSNYLSDNVITISLAKPPIALEKELKATTVPNLLQKVWQSVKSDPSETAILDLESGATYVFKKPVIDYFGNAFSPGDTLRYEQCYPPYHGLHVLLFAEATLYLHEGEHAELFCDFERFIACAPADHS